jgi:CubicO group peptidase (beta-lactamase class C family)
LKAYRFNYQLLQCCFIPKNDAKVHLFLQLRITKVTFTTDYSTKKSYLCLENKSFCHMNKTLFFLSVLICISLTTTAQILEKVIPEEVALNSFKLKSADSLIQSAISKQEIPGAVLAVVRHGKMAYLKAYGHKQVYPTKQPMDVNTVFDLASCTKPLATAISAMILYDRGLLRLEDNVNIYVPAFTYLNKEIRVVNLLTHTSGLPSYAPETLIRRRYGLHNPNGFMQYIDSCKRIFEPGNKMEYSCLNFITLQHVIENISGKSLRDFAKENIYDILGMYYTDFKPTGTMLEMCAPTSKLKNGTVLKGIVHDPLAREFNGGISGNAGLFSNANDIAILVAMLQNDGEWNGQRILNSTTVKLMRSVPDSLKNAGRTLGWDMSSTYSSCKGDSLSANTYCHTGYTGTSVVIDPDNDIAVILLTNRVHPIDKGSVVKLRKLVANAIAAAMTDKK